MFSFNPEGTSANLHRQFYYKNLKHVLDLQRERTFPISRWPLILIFFGLAVARDALRKQAFILSFANYSLRFEGTFKPYKIE